MITNAIPIGWQLVFAFIGGILSIFSPCIIAALPGFIAYFAGLSLQQAKDKSHERELFISSLYFSLGFSLIFLAFGLVASGLSALLIQNQLVLQQFSGVILIALGVVQTGLLQFKFLQHEFRIDHTKIKLGKSPHLKSFLIGALFAFSWTPCYGPIIGGIFTLSASNQTLWLSLLLFLVYSIGFTLPIIILSTIMGNLSGFIAKNRQLFRWSNLVAGLLLILIGFLIFSNNISSIVNWLNFIYTNNKLFY